MKILKSAKKKYFVILYVFIILFIFIKIILNSPGTKGSLIDEIIILTKQPYILNDVYNHENYKLTELSKGIINSFAKRLSKNEGYDKIYIDMSFDQYQIIKSNRKDALIKFKNSQYLSKKKNVNAKIKFEKKTYNARIRLKGDRADHWARNKRFSFNIRILNDDSLFNYRIFSITNHKSRSFPQNEVISKSVNRFGLQTPTFKTVKVIFNGNDWGLMYLEEQFSSNYFEKRKIKQVPIARFTSQEDARIISEVSDEVFANEDFHSLLKLQGLRHIKIYNEKKYKSKPNADKFISFFNSFNLISRDNILNDDEQKELLNFYNKEKFAILIAYNSVFNDWHSTDHANTRYYFNPYLGKIEPIPTDFLGSNGSNNFSRLNNIDELKLNLIKIDKIFSNLFNDEEFQIYFYKALLNIKKDLPNMKKDIGNLCKNYTKECYKGINFNNIDENLRLLTSNKNIFQNIKESRLEYLNLLNLNQKNSKFPKQVKDKIATKIKNHLYVRIFNDGHLYIENISTTDIEILNLKHIYEEGKLIKNHCQNFVNLNLKLESGQIYRESLKNYNFTECLELKNNLDLTYLVNKNIKKLELVVENSIFTKKNILSKFYDNYGFETSENYMDSFKFIKKIGNDYIIEKGEHIIDKPLFITSGKNLIINGGTSLSFSNKSYVYVENGNLIMNGTLSEKINLSSFSNSTWGGIFVSNSKNSYISHVKFENLDFFNDNINKIFVTGAINFYRSDVKISNVELKNSIAEDSLNLIESDFFIENIIVDNSISDALDIDFSKGTISNSKFLNVKGDSIDTSGSQVKLFDIQIENIGDKAISVGEKSKIMANKIKISNALNAIAVKDDSTLLAEEVIFENNATDISAYLKKSYYKNGGNIDLKNFSPDKLNILKDNKSNVVINNKIFDLVNYEYN